MDDKIGTICNIIGDKLRNMIKIKKQGTEINCYIKNITPKRIFLICSLVGILLYFPALWFWKTTVLEWIVMENNVGYQAGDYFQFLIKARDLSNVYTDDGTYFPALAYMLYYIIAKCSIYPNITLGDTFTVVNQPFN